jgi:16S rRNA G966 N2-methylase RsmD
MENKKLDNLDLEWVNCASGDGTWYANSANNHFLDIVSNITNTNKMNFLDIGCGKGGVIFLASDIFNNAIGVERNKKCYEVCLDNLKELKNCKIYNLDANDFNDYENIDFVYMYNPFGNKTMKSVLDNINKSRINKPRDILILYKNPIENDLLLENGFVCISTHNDHTREDNMVSKLYKKDYGNVS